MKEEPAHEENVTRARVWEDNFLRKRWRQERAVIAANYGPQEFLKKSSEFWKDKFLT